MSYIPTTKPPCFVFVITHHPCRWGSWPAPRHHHVAIGRRRTHVGGRVRIVRLNRNGATNGGLGGRTVAWFSPGGPGFFVSWNFSQSRQGSKTLHGQLRIGHAIENGKVLYGVRMGASGIISTYRQWRDRIVGIDMTGVEVSIKAKQAKRDSAEWEGKMLRK